MSVVAQFLPQLAGGGGSRRLTEGPQPRSGEDSATLAALAPLHHSLRSRSPSPSKLGEE